MSGRGGGGKRRGQGIFDSVLDFKRTSNLSKNLTGSHQMGFRSAFNDEVPSRKSSKIFTILNPPPTGWSSWEIDLRSISQDVRPRGGGKRRGQGIFDSVLDFKRTSNLSKTLTGSHQMGFRSAFNVNSGTRYHPENHQKISQL